MGLFGSDADIDWHDAACFLSGADLIDDICS